MAISAASIKLKFPEFSSIPNATIDEYILDSEFFFDPTIWNVRTASGRSIKDQGQSYFVASMLFTNIVTGAGGQNMFNAAPVVNKSAGQLSVGFSVGQINPEDTDALFMSNKYGQFYLAIRRSVVQGLTQTASAPLDLATLVPLNASGMA